MHDPVRDKGQEKYYDTYEDVWRTEIMYWYIKKVCGLYPKPPLDNQKSLTQPSDQDDDILRSRKIEFPFYRKFDEDVPAKDLIVKEALLECPIEREPPHPTKGELDSLSLLPNHRTKILIRDIF